MVDKVETPVEDIQREVELHQPLDHPTIAKVHGVFVESCFVCIVMDIYTGGDLIEAIQARLSSKGNIPCREVVHVSRQMVEAIQFLHSRGVVHRDVKGDNYLLDRQDLVDPECRVVLGDFGAACSLNNPEERLKNQVGTREYWSPEMFDDDYGPKVDVWAVGVVMYGLFEGCLPFRGELEIRNAVATFHEGTAPECRDFVEQMLRKEEKERPTADEVLTHPWLVSAADAAAAAAASAAAAKVMSSANIPKGSANAGITERRAELVGRLLESASKNGSHAEVSNENATHWQQRFEVTDRPTGISRTFEWYPEVDAEHLLLSAPGSLHLVDSTAHMITSPQEGKTPFTSSKGGEHPHAEGETLKVVGKMLAEHGIDTSLFGRNGAKTLEEFAIELGNGTARLMLDATAHKTLVRVVDVVLLRLRCQNGEHGDGYLMDAEEGSSDGASSTRLPGLKKEPHENTRMAARRACEKFWDIPWGQVSLAFDRVEVSEEQHESASYPGVNTVYRLDIVEGKLNSKDPALLQKILQRSKDRAAAESVRGRKSRFLRWMGVKECQERLVSRVPGPSRTAVSALVHAPVGLEEGAVREYLEASNIDTSKFGQGHAKSLGELAEELIKGESALMQRPDGEGVLRIVDMVVLRLRREDTDELLMQVAEALPDGIVDETLRPPSGKRRPDESQFMAAQRIVLRRLQMDPNCVSFDKEEVQVSSEETESHHYPGLRTLYRNRILSAVVHSPEWLKAHGGAEEDHH